MQDLHHDLSLIKVVKYNLKNWKEQAFEVYIQLLDSDPSEVIFMGH